MVVVGREEAWPANESAGRGRAPSLWPARHTTPVFITASHDNYSDSSCDSGSGPSAAMLTPMLSFLEASGSPPLAALHSMTEMKNGHGSAHANPHGIEHILARPSSVTMPRGYVGVGMAGYYKHPLAELTGRSGIYWPGLQGLVSNPMAWRDRLANSKYLPTLYVCSSIWFDNTVLLKVHV